MYYSEAPPRKTIQGNTNKGSGGGIGGKTPRATETKIRTQERVADVGSKKGGGVQGERNGRRQDLRTPKKRSPREKTDNIHVNTTKGGGTEEHRTGRQRRVNGVCKTPEAPKKQE